ERSTTPFFGRLQKSVHFSRQINLSTLAESECLEISIESLVSEGHPGLGCTDVAGFLNHLRECHPTQFVMVVNRRIGNHHLAIFTENHGTWRHHIFFKRRSRDYGFHSRPRLVGVRESTIAPSIWCQGSHNVWVKSWADCHRKNRTRL